MNSLSIQKSDQETIYRYNENDGVNPLVRELAFGIEFHFGSEAALYIDTIR